MSKYEEIAGIIRARISDGTYPIDSMLPIQSDLAKEFGVSRMTVKKAIEMLTIEGLVISKQGNGTKVLNSSKLGQRGFKISIEQLQWFK